MLNGTALQALWRGNGANCLRLIPDVAFKFTVNDQLKIMFSPADGTAPNVSTKLAAGAVTGVCLILARCA